MACRPTIGLRGGDGRVAQTWSPESHGGPAPVLGSFGLPCFLTPPTVGKRDASGTVDEFIHYLRLNAEERSVMQRSCSVFLFPFYTKRNRGTLQVGTLSGALPTTPPT